MACAEICRLLLSCATTARQKQLLTNPKMKTYLFSSRSHALIVEASSVSSARSALVFEVGAVRAAFYQLVSIL